MTVPTPLLIADDHPLIRRGLRMSVEDDQTLVVLGEAANGLDAVALATQLRPRIVLLDIEMPQLDGLKAARQILEAQPGMDIIFLTLHADADLYRTAIELGGKGYLLKDSAIQEVVTAIHTVLAGRLYVSSSLIPSLLQAGGARVPGSARSGLERLTATEHRIFRLISQGKTSKEIADELSIHYRTVENHRTNMCRKLSLDGEGANALLRFSVQNKTRF